eukprot:5797370-Alexandrium_andersonii.AAC.1
MPSWARSRSQPPLGSSLSAGCWSLWILGCPRRSRFSPSAAPSPSPRSLSMLAARVPVRSGAYMTCR